MSLDKITIKCQEALAKGQQLALEHGQTQIDAEHVFMALIDDAEGAIPVIIKKLGSPLELNDPVGRLTGGYELLP